MLDRAITKKLKKIVGEKGVLDTPEDLAVYGYDATFEDSPPDVVVLPTQTEQVAFDRAELNHILSLYGRMVAELPDDTTIWPGHDYGCRPSSTIGLKLYFAYALNNPFDFSSNPVHVTILP